MPRSISYLASVTTAIGSSTLFELFGKFCESHWVHTPSMCLSIGLVDTYVLQGASPGVIDFAPAVDAQSPLILFISSYSYSNSKCNSVFSVNLLEIHVGSKRREFDL